MLAINLEPVYGIILAALFLDIREYVYQFYLGVIIILATVIANGIIKANKGSVKAFVLVFWDENTLHMEYLSFEKPIEELELQLNKALELADDTGVDMAKTIEDIRKTREKKKKSRQPKCLGRF